MALDESSRNSARSEHLQGLFLTALGVLILTPDSLLIRLIQADTWTLLFWRGLLQGLALVAYYIVRYGRTASVHFRSIGWTGVWIAFLYTGGNVLFIQSIRLTYVANTLIILASAPLLGAVFSWLFLREHIRLQTWVATIVGLAGIAIIFTGSTVGASLIGEGYAFAAACFVAGTFVVIRSGKNVNMIPAVALSGFMVAIISLPFADTPFLLSGQDTLLLLILGGLIAPVSFSLITLGPRYLTAPEVSLFMLVETVLGPVWVWLVLREAPPSGTLLGGVIVLVTLIAHSCLSLREGKTQKNRSDSLPL